MAELTRPAPISSENLSEIIIKGLSDGLVVLNSDLSVVDVNDAFCEMTGYSHSELLSMTLRDVFCGLSSLPDLGLDQKQIQVQANTKNGNTFDCEVTFSWLDNVPGLVFGYIKSVSERTRINQKIRDFVEDYQSIFDYSPITMMEGDWSSIKRLIDYLTSKGIQDFDQYFDDHPETFKRAIEEAKVIRYNQIAEKLDRTVQTSKKTKDSYRMIKYFPVYYQTWKRTVLSLLSDPSPHIIEDSVLHPDGSIQFNRYVCYIPPAYQDTWSRLFYASVDISDLKNTEEKLRDNLEHQEEIVRQRTKELELASKRLEKLYQSEQLVRVALQDQIQQRIDFTRALVHELKTPITPMLVSSEILVNALEPGEPRAIAEELYDGTVLLNKRIDQLMDVARGEIGILEVDRRLCNISEVIQEACRKCAWLFKQRKQDFLIEIPNDLPVVPVDPERIQQVVTNLLNNANKFTQQGGEVLLRVNRVDEQIVVEVIDNGLGIPADKQESLFQPYSTLATSGKSVNGIGLGLSLCKMIISLHGGNIWMKDNPLGRGSLFGFSLPIDGGSA